MENVFHKGEEAVQQMVGETKMAKRVARGIQDSIYSGADNFMENQPMAFVASTDTSAQLWVSMLLGDVGFINVPNAKKLSFATEMIRCAKTDILYKNIMDNPEIGVLFINHGLRVRYRVNGMASLNGQNIQVAVQEAYGNCPKYIQAGVLSQPEDLKKVDAQITTGLRLSDSQKAWIGNAHTFYVATRSSEGKTDASHRGGNTGFVSILEDDTLRIPDYPGNSMFNTLGNIYENPNTGLLFVDFENGETLQLTGKAALHFDQTSEKDLQKTGATGRFWTFETNQWIHTKNQYQVVWDFWNYSPFNP
ncbi:MAG: pyridoxamine 5'-phosphate oxidase family protein [Saonia sp.]